MRSLLIRVLQDRDTKEAIQQTYVEPETIACMMAHLGHHAEFLQPSEDRHFLTAVFTTNLHDNGPRRSPESVGTAHCLLSNVEDQVTVRYDHLSALLGAKPLVDGRCRYRITHLFIRSIWISGRKQRPGQLVDCAARTDTRCARGHKRSRAEMSLDTRPGAEQQPLFSSPPAAVAGSLAGTPDSPSGSSAAAPASMVPLVPSGAP